MTLASSKTVTEELTVDTLAAAIKQLNVRKQNPDKLDDVLDLIEYLRVQAVTLHEENAEAARKLADREAFITKREAELALKMRAVQTIIGDKPARKYFWR